MQEIGTKNRAKYKLHIYKFRYIYKNINNKKKVKLLYSIIFYNFYNFSLFQHFFSPC